MHTPRIPPELLKRVRELRREMTFPERRLWGRLSDRQLMDLKFRKQHPIEPFIVDFYCAELRLVIEVDGASHDDPDYDAWRTRELEKADNCVIRFTNDEVIEDVDSVVERIVEIAGRRLKEMPNPPPPLPKREGRRRKRPPPLPGG